MSYGEEEMVGPKDDDLLVALKGLRTEHPDADRSRAILTDAARTMRRRRRAVDARLAFARAVYAGVIEPVAATGLSIGFLASVFVQALAVLQQSHGGIFRP